MNDNPSIATLKSDRKFAVKNLNAACKKIESLKSELTAAQERIAELEAKYHDLLYQVHNKIPVESRHETAKRIIQQHENKCSGPAQQDLTATQNAEGGVTHE